LLNFLHFHLHQSIAEDVRNRLVQKDAPTLIVSSTQFWWSIVIVDSTSICEISRRFTCRCVEGEIAGVWCDTRIELRRVVCRCT
jgi:hypothetical protein